MCRSGSSTFDKLIQRFYSLTGLVHRISQSPIGQEPPPRPSAHLCVRNTRKKTKLPKGAALARRKGFPNLPRFACADLRCAPPFPFRRWLRCKGGEPPPLHLATPPSPGGVRHVGTCHAWYEKQPQLLQSYSPVPSECEDGISVFRALGRLVHFPESKLRKRIHG